MKTETFDNPADFLAALNGKPRRSANHAREARPDIPRAERAERGGGDRVPDLMKLAANGWTCTHYDHAHGLHWLSSRNGRTTPRQPTYRAMLDEALKLCKPTSHNQ